MAKDKTPNVTIEKAPGNYRIRVMKAGKVTEEHWANTKFTAQILAGKLGDWCYIPFSKK